MAEFKQILTLQTESGQSVSIDLRNALILSTAPTASTAARAGMQAYVVSGGTITAEYVCTAVSGSTYTWVQREVSGGGGLDGLTETVEIIRDQAPYINFWTHGDVTVTGGYKTFAVNMPAGTYDIELYVTSTDTDRSRCYIRYYKGSTLITDGYVYRDELFKFAITLDDYIDTIYLYTSESAPEGSGDTATYSNFSIKSTGGIYGKAVVETAVDALARAEVDNLTKGFAIDEIEYDILTGYARDSLSATKNPYPSPTRSTTKQLIPVKPGTNIVASPLTEYRWAIAVFEPDGTALGDNGWEAIVSREIKSTGSIGINFKRADEGTMTDEDTAKLLGGIVVFNKEPTFVKTINGSKPDNDGNVNIGNDVAERLYNPFRKLLYHHLNQETISAIPAQSIYDIQYAKTLGFDIYEVNPHPCSDGVRVCKHGSQGKLGYGLKAKDGGDYSGTLFSDVTSTWLRENITYNTPYTKYAGFIPTLEEVCRECRRLNMSLKVGSTADRNEARKILPDYMIWETTYSGNYVRGGFAGVIEYVYYKTESIDSCIAKCKRIGAPVNIVIASGDYDKYTDAEISTLVAAAHENGFTVGIVYPTPNILNDAFRLGVDEAGSTGADVNLLEVGNRFNICALNDSKLSITNGEYSAVDDTLYLASGGTVIVTDEAFASGIVSVRIRYKGTLTITGAAAQAQALKQYVSDGVQEVQYSVVKQLKTDKSKYTQWVSIEADTDVDIYDLSIKCSLI